MSKFTWRIDSENYLSNNSKYADKMNVKHFIDKVCCSMDDYSKKYSLEQLRNNKIPHCHSCQNLRAREGGDAKRLYKHLKEINEKFSDKSIQIDDCDIYQFKVKGIVEKQEYRCFGYIMSCDLQNENIFNLVYLDPDHEVYKE
jgi:hypothetical protein